MPNIIHAADFHIGAKFDFLPSDRAAEAVSLQLSALQELISYAASSAADAGRTSRSAGPRRSSRG